MARAWMLLLAVLAWPRPMHAQDPATADSTAPASRAEALVLRRTEREQALHPDAPTRLERLLTWAEESHLVERLNPPQGFYPVVGSIVRGSAMGLGAGYRRRPAAGRVLLDTSVAWTYRGYKSAQAAIGLPSMGSRPVDLMAGVRWFDYPQEDFFGLGRDTRQSDRVSFTLRGTDTYAQVQGRRARWFVARARAGVLRYDLAPGKDARFPSIEALFTDTRAPGLAGAPTLGYAESSLGIDTRDQPGNTRGGGLYTVSLGAYRDDAGGDFAFNRVDVKLMHVFPIFDKKRGIALHALASRIDPVGAARVPFFLMPTVGGNDSLRGFRDFRFRDAAALNVNAEYRWEAFSGLDLALFLDAGDVGPTWRSLVGAHLRSSWGVGFRFNTNRRVFLRVDVAGGREGPRIWTALGPVFRR
jgi:hypothetical protein